MTASQPLPLAELSPAELAEIERFGIYEAEEKVARALFSIPVMVSWRSRRLYGAEGGFYGLTERNAQTLAAAAIAALPVSPAAGAVKRVEALAEGDEYAWNGATHNSRIRAAIAAPQTGEHATDEEADRG